MDSEERHELDKNDLAHFLMTRMERLRPYLGYIGLAGLVAAVGLVAGAYMNQASQAKLREGWGVLAAATTPDGLSQVMADYPNTSLASLAQVKLGWIRLNEGKDRLVDDRGEAIRLLSEAAESFDAAVSSSAPDSVKTQALLGSALAKECQSMVEEAKKRYQEILDLYPTQPVAELARIRLDNLAKEESVTFYMSFKNYQPPAPSTDLPTKIDPAQVPSPPEIPTSIDSSLPSVVPPPPADISSPGLPTIEGTLPGSSPPTPPAEVAPPVTPPTEPSSTPAPSAPATPPSAEGTPSAPATPPQP
jgi:hypothetical protein